MFRDKLWLSLALTIPVVTLPIAMGAIAAQLVRGLQLRFESNPLPVAVPKPA